MSDTQLNILFPHSGQPTHIWIDKEQKFTEMTSGESTTIKNINAFLNGEEVKFQDKQEYINIDVNDPLSWLCKRSNISAYLPYYSFIIHGTNFGRGQGGPTSDPSLARFKVDSSSNKVIGISSMNSSIIGLYKLAFRDWMPNKYIPDSRILLESRNRRRFFFDNNSDFFEWADSNTFSYGLGVSLSNSNRLQKIMTQDLDRFFHIKSKIEKRKVMCLVLKGKLKDNWCSTKSNVERLQKILKESKVILDLENVTINTLYQEIDNVIKSQNSFRSIPFLNEASCDSKINMKLSWSENPENISVSLLKKELRSWGLILIEEPRYLDMLVIKELK